MPADYADWFEDGEWVPEFTWCEDCGDRLHFRDSVQCFDGSAMEDNKEVIITVLVCYECADMRIRV